MAYAPAPRQTTAAAAAAPPPTGSMGAARKKRLLDVLSEVKTRVQDKLGIVDFPMPKFILIGSQSVGKSRLVETFAGEPFNFCSGTLGSRRPTVLEFRNVPNAPGTKWYVMEVSSNQWMQKTMQDVMAFVEQAHNSLGHSVSAEPIYIKVESAQCADMAIVDLPGYRNFAANPAQQQLAQQIEALNKTFLLDPNNTILCVEEAGDAANLSSLRRVMNVDPQFKRSILIRTKLDKYYGDLTPDNVNKWLEGYGDLPKELTKYALTLPHWSDSQQAPPEPMHQLRTQANDKDMQVMASHNTSKKFRDTVGYTNFARYMEVKIERMFVDAIQPVLQKLKALEESMEQKDHDLDDALLLSNPSQVLATVRAVGMSFAYCLNHIMEGVIQSDVNRMTLRDELKEFHSYHKKLGDTDNFLVLPCEEIRDLDDYVDYLETYIKVPAHEVAINGGAQFRRLMFEVETYLRFSEIGDDTKKRDVLQSMGISMNAVTWREVVVKLLNHDAHLPLQRRIRYVAERIKWFFIMQKEPIVAFMESIRDSPDAKLYSVLYTKHAKLLKENPMIKQLVFDTFDMVLERQLQQFVDLFNSTLHATFSNPWVFLKKSTATLDDKLDEDACLPSAADTRKRIPDEIKSRTAIERTVAKWIYDIPTEPHNIDQAVDDVQLLVLKVYCHIRSQVCDQVELFAESFFKMPLMRRLEEDMNKIELSEVHNSGNRIKRERAEQEKVTNAHGLVEVKDCHQVLSDFALSCT